MWDSKMNNTSRTATISPDVTIQVAVCTFSVSAVVLGLPGNFLLIHAVRSRKQMQNDKNYFIVSLACSDLAGLLIAVPFLTLNYGNFSLYMPEVLCKVLPPAGSVMLAISMYTHVAIALERRRAIVFPLLPKPSPRRIKIFIWTIWLVPLLVLGPTTSYFHGSHSLVFCTIHRKLRNEFMITYLAGIPTVVFFIPLGIIIWAYRQVIYALKQNVIPSEGSESNFAVMARIKNHQKVINSLIALACIFTALTFPFCIVNILIALFINGPPKASLVLGSAFPITLSIHFTTYVLNPVTLYTTSTDYRTAINESFNVWRNIFCKKCCHCKNKGSLNNEEHCNTVPGVIVLSVIKKRGDGN